MKDLKIMPLKWIMLKDYLKDYSKRVSNLSVESEFVFRCKNPELFKFNCSFVKGLIDELEYDSDCLKNELEYFKSDDYSGLKYEVSFIERVLSLVDEERDFIVKQFLSNWD